MPNGANPCAKSESSFVIHSRLIDASPRNPCRDASKVNSASAFLGPADSTCAALSGSIRASRRAVKANGIQRLQIAAIDFHSEALHDGIQREDDAEAVLLAHDDPLHPSKSASSNPRPLTHFQ